MRRSLPIALVLLFLPGTAEGQKVKEQYDRFRDQTTVVYFLLYDAPFSGPQTSFQVMYFFPGQEQFTPPDSVAFVVKMTSVGTAAIDAGGWKLLQRPPLYVLANDSLRLEFEPVAANSDTGTLGGLGYKLEESLGYAIGTDQVLRLLGMSKLAFKVGPWERELKHDELEDFRNFARERLVADEP